MQLAHCILSPPHGNADPECGLSINKSALQSHGTSLEEDMIVPLWLVKDYIVLNNGVDKTDIESRSLNLAEMAESWTCHATFLNEKKKIEMETKKELERRQKEKNLKLK